VRSALQQPSDGDRQALIQTLVDNIMLQLPNLGKLLEACDDQWGGEDHVYRFYHRSLKVYRIQELTGQLVDALRSLLPNRPLDADFEQIMREGTGHTFAHEHNREWLLHTRPMLEAFWHAQYMVSMVVRYGPQFSALPPGLPSGWAAVLTLYGLR
jgi:hypothetical protein